MADPTDLDGIARTAHRDTQRDGLTEIVIGVFLFIVALATGRPAFYWTYLVGILVLGRGLRWLKARYTYQRIGFAELPDEDPSTFRWGVLSWMLGVFGVVAAGFAISGDLTNNLAWRQWSPALAGLLFMGGFLYLGSRSGLARQYAYALISPALGVLLATRTFVEPYQGVRVWALVMALLLLTIGGIVFLRFLRDNPVIGGGAPETDLGACHGENQGGHECASPSAAGDRPVGA
jgi:hypothetical protein